MLFIINSQISHFGGPSGKGELVLSEALLVTHYMKMLFS